MIPAVSIALQTHGLKKNFGAVEVTRDISLAFETAKRYAVIGPNGAGKTTLFNLLAGNLRPDAGTLMLGARNVTTLDATRRARLGIARSFQQNNLFPERTVRENLALALAVHGGMTSVFWRPLQGMRAIQQAAESGAERVGLSDSLDIEVRHLSYGSQRQLEVGLALACDPKVLLLDEPTAGMSPEETARMHALMVGLPETLTLVIVEHDMDIVMDIAHRIIVLDYGRVLLEGTPAEIRGSELVRQRYLGERRPATHAGQA